MAKNARRSRPVRRGFGILAGAVAAADLVVATAATGNDLGIPTAPVDTRGSMLAYGAVLLAMSIWSVATSFGRTTTNAAGAGKDGSSDTSADASDAERQMAEERTVIHDLRRYGWYVADDVVLPHVDIDHVAIGPAGVLAVQVQWTNRPDARGRPAARARIAAHQLRKALAVKELNVDVVPAILTFGPGLTNEPGGVRVVDAVAFLNGYQSEEWLSELGGRALLSGALVDSVRSVVADLREGQPVSAGLDPSLEPVLATR